MVDFVVDDIDRISRRVIVPLVDWRKDTETQIPSVAVEEPVYRNEFEVGRDALSQGALIPKKEKFIPSSGWA